MLLRAAKTTLYGITAQKALTRIFTVMKTSNLALLKIA